MSGTGAPEQRDVLADVLSSNLGMADVATAFPGSTPALLHLFS